MTVRSPLEAIEPAPRFPPSATGPSRNTTGTAGIEAEIASTAPASRAMRPPSRPALSDVSCVRMAALAQSSGSQRVRGGPSRREIPIGSFFQPRMKSCSFGFDGLMLGMALLPRRTN